MLLGEVLIREFVAVDGLTASSVEGGEVTTLEHELRDYTVENGVFVTEALLTSAKSTEVLSSLRDDIVVELESDAAQRLAVGASIEENLVAHPEC